MIFTGDLGAASERWLLRAYELPERGVIVAGHHGSKNSSSEEWLDSLKPQAAVISVGANAFGHPAEETLTRFSERRIKTFRTDESGTIVLRVSY
jgi:competence protein ComEC